MIKYGEVIKRCLSRSQLVPVHGLGRKFLNLDVIKVYDSLRARPAVLCERYNTYDPEAIPNNGTALINRNEPDHITVDQIQFFNTTGTQKSIALLTE